MTSSHRVLRGSITHGSWFSRTSPARRIHQLMPTEARRRHRERRESARRWREQYAKLTPYLLESNERFINPRGDIGYEVVYHADSGSVNLRSEGEPAVRTAFQQAMSSLRDGFGIRWR